MDSSKTFLPYTGPPDLREEWKKNIMVFLFFSVPCFFIGDDGLGMKLGFEACIFIGFIIYLFNNRMTVSLIISIPDKMLVYYTVNCFGNKRETKIYLPTAIISYEYRQVRKYIKGMRLKIYGRNGDSVTLREDMDGYRQGELDQIVAFIAELKP
ncbi:hypothetical protein HDF19_05695 [Mucilaginibacter sp. E4BP6]|uniref:hypothetical protein n=1 Tax=Mucilaginibacter sp. E4BP6 TaxID=2723089 RepID=UPI0015CE26D7|nr:hypothetical protein [Mucilaginibacter sp. E4BP6]